MKKQHYQADIAIIGGGIAGIVTALELLNTGKSIALFDRDTEDNFGGLAKESFGGMFLSDHPSKNFQGSRIMSIKQKRTGILLQNLTKMNSGAKNGPMPFWNLPRKSITG